MKRISNLISLLGLSMVLFSACNLPADELSSSDEFATALAAYGSPTPINAIAEGGIFDPQPTAATTATPLIPTRGEPTGKIVFTCQTTVKYYLNQLCIINADGTGWRRLTFDDTADHYFASIAPEGQSIIYSTNFENQYEVYELDLAEGAEPVRLTFSRNNFAPEISPDGTRFIYTHNTGPNLADGQIWISDRDGSNPKALTTEKGGGWDPVWSPDGTEIMFASTVDGSAQMLILNLESSATRQVTDFTELRGRNDWSVNGQLATYKGVHWYREIILFDLDGGNMRYLTDGGHNLAPSFSPDGQWIVFTSYMDRYKNNNGCEIYIMRLDGSDIRRLTDNFYCDWQPRWGR